MDTKDIVKCQYERHEVYQVKVCFVGLIFLYLWCLECDSRYIKDGLL